VEEGEAAGGVREGDKVPDLSLVHGRQRRAGVVGVDGEPERVCVEAREVESDGPVGQDG